MRVKQGNQTMNFNSYTNKWVNKHPEAPLREKLRHIRVPDLRELDEAMERNPKLRKALQTPLGKLPPNSLGYSYNYFSNLPPMFTLYHAISFTLQDFFTEGEFFYSEANGELEGFVFYTLKGKASKTTTPYIWEIGIISFDLGISNSVLMRDTIKLFSELKEKYPLISWQADKRNPACAMYKKIVKKYNGEIKDDPKDPSCYRFYIYSEKV